MNSKRKEVNEIISTRAKYGNEWSVYATIGQSGNCAFRSVGLTGPVRVTNLLSEEPIFRQELSHKFVKDVLLKKIVKTDSNVWTTFPSRSVGPFQAGLNLVDISQSRKSIRFFSRPVMQIETGQTRCCVIWDWTTVRKECVVGKFREICNSQLQV